MKFKSLFSLLAIVVFGLSGSLFAQQSQGATSPVSTETIGEDPGNNPTLTSEKQAVILQLRREGARYKEGGCGAKATDNYVRDIAAHNPKIIQRKQIEEGQDEATRED